MRALAEKTKKTKIKKTTWKKKHIAEFNESTACIYFAYSNRLER